MIKDHLTARKKYTLSEYLDQCFKTRMHEIRESLPQEDRRPVDAIDPFDPPSEFEPEPKVRHTWPERELPEQVWNEVWGPQPTMHQSKYDSCGFPNEGMPVAHGTATMGSYCTGINASTSISKLMGEFHCSAFS